MFFIVVLVITTLCIASSAAFFSVYGLVQLFHGISLYVLIMGSSLELGKLVSISYLYRYWQLTSIWLKIYLMLGIFALMVLTSMGIFGLLSVGYMTDSLPIKQIEQQVQLLDEEKGRLIDRKKQIDTQIANLPMEMSKGRVKLINGFKNEQEQTTNRINALSKEILETKTKLIQSEAHVGPITYIAKAFKLEADDATKYLIYLIIFVFDPMAVALTLAVNITLRDKRETDEEEVNWFPIENVVEDVPEVVQEVIVPTEQKEDPIIHYSVSDNNPYTMDTTKSDSAEITNMSWNITPVVPTIKDPLVMDEPEPVERPMRRVRPYTGVNSNTSPEELLQQHSYYETREAQGDHLTADERWAYQAVKTALHNQGYNIYV